MTDTIVTEPAKPAEEPLLKDLDLRRVRRRRAVLVNGLRLAVLAIALVAWQILSGPPSRPGVLIDEFYVSKPTDIAAAIAKWYTAGVLWSSILTTLNETVLGFVIGAGLGIAFGFLLGTNDLLRDVLGPFIRALNSLPRLALVPLFLLWFGLGLSSKLVLVATVVFFLVFQTAYSGIADVDRGLTDLLRLMKAPRWKVHLKATLPSAMTWIIAGLGVSVPYALVAAVTGEMIASNKGMGFLLIRSSSQFYTAGVFGAMVVLMVMAVALSSLVSLLDRYALRWKPDRLGATERR